MNELDTNNDNNGLLDGAAALKPFLEMVPAQQQDHQGLSSSSSLNVSTLRSLVLKILSHPDIFCGFDQFNAAAKSALRQQGDSSSNNNNNNFTIISNTLDLFSYGTLKDFLQQQTSNMYLPLNDSAQAKLGQLTVLSSIQDACFHGNLCIFYAKLAESLGWIEPTGDATLVTENDAWIRKIEEILIQCVYAGILKGKVCQKTRSFRWEHESLPVACSRDVPPDRIPQLLAALQGLGRRLEANEQQMFQAEGFVTDGLNDAANAMNFIKNQEKSAQQAKSHHPGKGGRHGGLGEALGFAFGRDAASGGQGPSAGRSSRASKRSRGGGSFANESAFRM